MGKSHSHINFASCLVAAIFLILVAAVAVTVYFTLFKPRDPKLSVTAVQLPAFSAANNNSTANFTFSQYVAVHNPNRAVFAHYDSTLQLLHGGVQFGFMFIPAGKIGPHKTHYLAATFAVKSFPLADSGQAVTVGPTPIKADGVGNGYPTRPSAEIDSKLEIVGRVRVLHFFTHHVVVTAECTVAFAVGDGSILGVRCY